MGTVLEELNTLKLLIAAGKENEIVHLVRVDQDRKRKKTTKVQTRFSVDCGTPEIFKDLFTEYDRILTQVTNKTMALSIIVDWLRALTPERIQKKLTAGEQATKPPKSNLPEWLKS